MVELADVCDPSEMMRLNTGIAPTPRASQSTFGVAGNDLAGFPNGRRPGDEALNAAAGDGWRFESVHFVTQPGNRRPMMAFLLFTRNVLPQGV